MKWRQEKRGGGGGGHQSGGKFKRERGKLKDTKNKKSILVFLLCS